MWPFRARRPVWLAAVATSLLMASCAGLGASKGSPISAWAQGPVRWLLQPRERRALRRVHTDRQAATFIEEFWRRRDPTPESPSNTVAKRFFKRVQDADRLYAEDHTRGSLTDRGRALILLGAPSQLTLTHRPALAWEPHSGAGGARDLLTAVEIWGYSPSDLDPPLRRALTGKAREHGIELTFYLEAGKVRLVNGERYLSLAAKVLVRR